MYVYLIDGRVSEIIPDYNPAFPDIPIYKRYTPEFVKKLMYVENDVEVTKNDMYDPETGTFAPPPQPEYIPPEEEDPPPTTPEEASTRDIVNALSEVVFEV